MSTERWAPIFGYEGIYDVSTLGNIRSRDRIDSSGARRTGKPMALKTARDGYLSVSLCKNGKPRMLKVQRLVLETFVSPKPLRHQSCHNDGNRANNALDNLRWDTPKNNAADRLKHGTHQFGERHPNSKFNAVDVERVYDLRAAGLVHKKIGPWLGMSFQNVGDILRGKAWKHLRASPHQSQDRSV